MYVCMLLPILTAGEDERTGVFVHWEIMELQLAFCVDGHPGEGEKRRERNTYTKTSEALKNASDYFISLRMKHMA